ncbi:hypothetical protein T484DRAFT_1756105 [Baffinella frigidus]|nr:hypothetical protein T484DRAFT_1756105 [Cryptophyta sp. CCMP2293]
MWLAGRAALAMWLAGRGTLAMRVIGRAALDAMMAETASSDITPPNTMSDVLSSLCDTLDNFIVEYEDLCPDFHWDEQFASNTPSEHPLYRTKRCLHGSFEQCPMRCMCPFAHTGDQMRPMRSLETQQFSYKLRLTHLGREIFTCKTHGIFRDQNSAIENVALQCIDYIDQFHPVALYDDHDDSPSPHVDHQVDNAAHQPKFRCVKSS